MWRISSHLQISASISCKHSISPRTTNEIIQFNEPFPGFVYVISSILVKSCFQGIIQLMIKAPLRLFDSLSPSKQLDTKPIDIAQRSIPAEQYNYFDYAELDSDGYDGYDIIINNLAPSIGVCLVIFSELESNLEYHLYSLISERTDQLGMIITHPMTYEQKLLTYINLLRIFPVQENPSQYTKDVRQLKKHLKRAGEIRNIIAHAKWPSLTKDGFVFSSIDATSSPNAEISLKYYKLDKDKLDEYRSYLNAVANTCNYVYSEYFG